MPSHGNYASVIQNYDAAVDDVAARVQQDRALHMHDLTSVYMQSIVTGMPSAYLTMMENTIGERSMYNDRKMVLDAADLTMQNKKLTRALGPNAGTLSGGGVADHSHAALRGMHYSAKRSNALHTNFNQKLAHDRSIHSAELNALLNLTPPNTPVGSILRGLVTMRRENNRVRTDHDAQMWARVDSDVGASLGGGGNAAEVLNHGVAETLRGSGANTNIQALRGGGNYHFGSANASMLWQNMQA